MERVVTRAIILDEENSVLLAERVSGAGAGQLAFVGGKPEGEESPEDAIRREIREELGVLFTQLVFWKAEQDLDTDPRKPWVNYYFYGRIEGEIRVQKEEISDARYYSLDEISDLDIAFNHKKIIAQFFDEVIHTHR